MSVLAAFALQTWQDDRNDRAHELRRIKEMRKEFVTSGLALDSLEQLHRISEGKLTRLDALLETADAATNADSILFLGQALWFFNNYFPNMPAYEELLSATGLQGVHNDELRRALFQYEATAKLNADFDEYVRSSSISSWETLVASRMPQLTSSDPLEDPLRRLLPDVRHLAKDLEFRNLIATRKFTEAGLAGRSAQLRIAVANVIKLIDADVGH
ncbi:MAG: hypothetical protein SGI92_03305 [Bryobacteraceae bacterium]|nr:hypothetical protein [Bryobacteraceae bacterium]